MARKFILVLGLFVAACSLGAVTWITTLSAALVLIATAQFFVSMCPLTCWLLVQELVPHSRIGTVGGYVHLLSNIAGIVGPAATGFIIQYGGGYSLSFLLAGGLVVLGALLVLVFVRTPAASSATRPCENTAWSVTAGGHAPGLSVRNGHAEPGGQRTQAGPGIDHAAARRCASRSARLRASGSPGTSTSSTPSAAGEDLT